MLYFIPAWYQQDQWCENEQRWSIRRMHTEFDDTVKQIQLFHRNTPLNPMNFLSLHRCIFCGPLPKIVMYKNYLYYITTSRDGKKILSPKNDRKLPCFCRKMHTSHNTIT